MSLGAMKLAAALLLLDATSAHAAQCLSYSSSIALQGALSRHIFSEQPNYDSIANGDAKAVYFFLSPSKPSVSPRELPPMAVSLRSHASMRYSLSFRTVVSLINGCAPIYAKWLFVTAVSSTRSPGIIIRLCSWTVPNAAQAISPPELRQRPRRPIS
jgi:hypothetical protein